MTYSYTDPRPLKNIPDSLLALMSSQLHLYSTALFRVWMDGQGIRQALHIGSGTFVAIRGVHGVLTAQHVPERLRIGENLGLSAAREGEEHAMVVERGTIRVIDVAKRELDEYGPDLSFVVLADWDDIATIKAFHSLDGDAEELLNSPPRQDGGLWFFCGVPEKRMLDEPSERGFFSIKSFQELCLAGGPTVICQRGDYDYVDLDAETLIDTPSTFAGMSGGGLWQVTLSPSESGVPTPSRYLFSGVNFYEGIRSNGTRYMRCHGRRSIYEHVFRAVTR